VAWCWSLGEDCRLVAVNLSTSRSQGLVRLPAGQIQDKSVSLEDIFSSIVYRLDGYEISEAGLFVDLLPWGYHFFRIRMD
jgi:hypothetical protein